jgi:hypothetical protein
MTSWPGSEAKDASVKMRRNYSKALTRFLHASREHARLGGALAVPLDQLERAAEFDQEWNAHWTPPDRYAKHRAAVALAYQLVSRWQPNSVAATSRGLLDKVALLLLNEPGVRTLFRQIRNFQIRTRQTSRAPVSSK